MERNVNRDFVEEFDEIGIDDEFTVESVSLYSLVYKVGVPATDIYLGWDDVSLIATER